MCSSGRPQSHDVPALASKCLGLEDNAGLSHCKALFEFSVLTFENNYLFDVMRILFMVLFSCFVFEKVLYNPGWPQIHFVAEVGFNS